MNYIKLFLLLIMLIEAPPILAVTMESSGNQTPELISEFGKTGTVDSVDPKGQWIRINNKKYVLRGSGSIKFENLHSGLRVHYNVEKAKHERNGRVTRMWVDDNAY